MKSVTRIVEVTTVPTSNLTTNTQSILSASAIVLSVTTKLLTILAQPGLSVTLHVQLAAYPMIPPNVSHVHRLSLLWLTVPSHQARQPHVPSRPLTTHNFSWPSTKTRKSAHRNWKASRTTQQQLNRLLVLYSVGSCTNKTSSSTCRFPARKSSSRSTRFLSTRNCSSECEPSLSAPQRTWLSCWRWVVRRLSQQKAFWRPTLKPSSKDKSSTPQQLSHCRLTSAPKEKPAEKWSKTSAFSTRSVLRSAWATSVPPLNRTSKTLSCSSVSIHVPQVTLRAETDARPEPCAIRPAQLVQPRMTLLNALFATHHWRRSTTTRSEPEWLQQLAQWHRRTGHSFWWQWTKTLCWFHRRWRAWCTTHWLSQHREQLWDRFCTIRTSLSSAHLQATQSRLTSITQFMRRFTHEPGFLLNVLLETTLPYQWIWLAQRFRNYWILQANLLSRLKQLTTQLLSASLLSSEPMLKNAVKSSKMFQFISINVNSFVRATFALMVSLTLNIHLFPSVLMIVQ